MSANGPRSSYPVLPPPPPTAEEEPPPPIPFGEYPSPPTLRDVPPTHASAVWSLTMGLLSIPAAVFYASAVFGVIAIVLAVFSARDIRRSPAVYGGRGVAHVGSAFGAIGIVIFIAQIGVLGYAFLSNRTVRHSVGKIEVVDIRRGTPLAVQVAREVDRAAQAGKQVLIETIAVPCNACDQVEATLSDPRMQSALGDVVFLRVDVKKFQTELAPTGMLTPTLPWFYRLDLTARPVERISADEWDENQAANIAPVLGAFAHGKPIPKERGDGRGIDL